MNVAITLLLLVATSTASSLYDTKKRFKRTSETITVSMEIVPAAGWKWNKHYPFKFFINLPANTKLLKEDITFFEGRARLTFSIQGRTKLIKEVAVEGTFSLCTDTLCKTWRREKFSIGEKE